MSKIKTYRVSVQASYLKTLSALPTLVSGERSWSLVSLARLFCRAARSTDCVNQQKVGHVRDEPYTENAFKSPSETLSSAERPSAWWWCVRGLSAWRARTETTVSVAG